MTMRFLVVSNNTFGGNVTTVQVLYLCVVALYCREVEDSWPTFGIIQG